MGLTFFQDNVRLQFQFEQSTLDPGIKYSGYGFAFKLLANVGNIPFNYFFGPDWDFFSMSFAIGANFSYFTCNGAEFAFTQEGRFVTAIIGQWEFAKFSIPGWKLFKSFGFYTECQLWILSTDLITEDTLVCKFPSFGLRVNVF